MTLHPSAGGAATLTPVAPATGTAPPAPPALPEPPARKCWLPEPRATERQCQTTIIEAAGILGYRVLSIRPARRASGSWETPVQGDPGYPDLTLCHANVGVLFVELKRAPNKLEPDQHAWREALTAAGAEWRLIYVPERMQAFIDELRDRAAGR